MRRQTVTLNYSKELPLARGIGPVSVLTIYTAQAKPRYGWPRR